VFNDLIMHSPWKVERVTGLWHQILGKKTGGR